MAIFGRIYCLKRSKVRFLPFQFDVKKNDRLARQSEEEQKKTAEQLLQDDPYKPKNNYGLKQRTFI